MFLNPWDGLCGLQQIEAVPKKILHPFETAPEDHNSFSDYSLKDYLTKIRNPDTPHPSDIVLDATDQLLLSDVVARLERLSDVIGYGNFAVLGFDDAIQFASAQQKVGSFSRNELDFLEMIYSRDASDYGFYGSKQVTRLTQTISTHDIEKIPSTGNYLFKGDAVKKYKQIKTILGEEAVLTSGIRGIVKQFYLFLHKARRHDGNLSLASRSLAPPGYSYHARGDFDIGQRGMGGANFSERFTGTSVFKKLTERGFVEYRYKRDNLLGVRYEPWHIKLEKG